MASEHTGTFLRVAAIQLRELADSSPEIARELHHIADQLDAEASEIEGDE
jgi:hypothetical protein